MDGIIGGLLLWVLLSAAVAAYAGNRGRSGILYFVFSLLFSPLIGFLIAAVVCSEKPAPTPLPSSLIKCPDCAEMIQAEARKCRFCGARFEEAPSVLIAIDSPMESGAAAPSEPAVKLGPGVVIGALVILLLIIISVVVMLDNGRAPMTRAAASAAASASVEAAPAPAPVRVREKKSSVWPWLAEPKYRLRVRIVAVEGVVAINVRADGAQIIDKEMRGGSDTWAGANDAVVIGSSDWRRLRIFANGTEMPRPSGLAFQAVTIRLGPDGTPNSSAPPPGHH